VSVVIDSSMALTWCFEDEASPQSDAIFERVRDDGAVVPALWHLELANVLLQAEKRGRIALGDVATRLKLISELPITTDHETPMRAWREVIALARAGKNPYATVPKASRIQWLSVKPDTQTGATAAPGS